MLLTGDVAAAQRRAETLTGNARTDADRIIAAWQGDPTAIASLQSAATPSPQDLLLIAWNARIARQNGDSAAQQRYENWANILAPGDGDLALDTRVVTSVGAIHGFGGVDPSVYGLYTYRRPMPQDILAPSLPHLAQE